jgi:hypothetical protein
LRAIVRVNACLIMSLMIQHSPLPWADASSALEKTIQ